MDLSRHPSFLILSLPCTLLSTLSLFTLTLFHFFGTASADDTSESSRQSPIALSYYNLVIQEYSYKFWASFMVATLVILVYSCLAAVWLSKTVYAAPPIQYDSYDYLLKRSASEEDEELDLVDPYMWSSPPSPRATRRILTSITSPPFTT